MAIFLTNNAGKFLIDEAGRFILFEKAEEPTFAGVRKRFTVLPRTIMFRTLSRLKRN